MLRKYFPRDKNYILESAQLASRDHLLHYLVEFVKAEYVRKNNPLGLEDDLIRRMRTHRQYDFPHLNDFYLSLSGIFRFVFYSDNQLEFDFAGGDAATKYREQWKNQFRIWVAEFCRSRKFVRTVLDVTLFYDEDAVLLMDTRLQTFLQEFFEVRIHPEKGILRQKVA